MFNKLAVAIILLLCSACSRSSDAARPQGVSTGAVFVRGAKVGWWQECIPGTEGQAVHCRIWNEAGAVLVDEEFLPYDSGRAPTAEELKIPPDASFAGPDRIFLANKRVLLPRSRFEELKKFVDWLEGKASAPR